MARFLSIISSWQKCNVLWHLVIVFSLLSAKLEAKETYNRFNHLTIKEGLSSNRVQCIWRDSKNYVWLATDVGLERYNSMDIVSFRNNDKIEGSISNNDVRTIFEDSKQNLWFGTMNGLNLYDRSTNTFKIFNYDVTDKTSIGGDVISSIIEDQRGNVWFVSDGNCLNKWIPESRSFERFPFVNRHIDVATRHVRMLAVDSKGIIWIAPKGRGVYSFNPEKENFVFYDDKAIGLEGYCDKSICVDSNDKVWITADGGGFFSYDPARSSFKQYPSSGGGVGTNLSKIVDIIPEDDRYLLLAVDQGGINRFDKKTETFEYILGEVHNETGLNNNGIWCFHKDKDNILWIGTSGGGLNYYMPKSEKFNLFQYSGDSPKSPSYSFVGCFYEDYEGLIWVGTDGGGVNVYDPKTEMFTKYKHDPNNPNSISGNVIRCIAEDKNHDVWIATWDSGLNRYDRKTGTFHHFLPNKKDSTSISSRSIWTFKFDHKGLLWLAIYNGGIDVFDIKKGVIKRFRADSANLSALSTNEVWFLYEDNLANMWVCTRHGLNLYNSKKNGFDKFSFPDNQVVSFLKDSKGFMWIGTKTGGIYKCRSDFSIIKIYTREDGLCSDQIQAIVEDNSSNLWFSTDHGISNFNRSTETFRNYSQLDGLQGNQFFQQSFLKTKAGEIYFGGFTGFNSFYPDSLKDNTIVPPVYITDLQIFNKPVLDGSNKEQFPVHISEAETIKLNWKQSVFSLSFVAINYNHPEKNQYAYMLEGFDETWNFTDATRRYATYTNLDPGKYTFKVKASNNDAVWNEDGVSLEIIVLPPWYKTLFFRITFSLAIMGVLIGYYFIRIKKIETQRIRLEYLVAEGTRELNKKNQELEIQAVELSETNSLLVERQRQIEEQANLLKKHRDDLQKVNGLLVEKQKLVTNQADELIKANENLTISNAAKDKFLSIIAHDLRNPFNSILGFTELFMENVSEFSEKEIKNYARIIHTSSERLYHLLNDLLQWANAQSGNILCKPEHFDLYEVLHYNYELVKNSLALKRIDFIIENEMESLVYSDRNMVDTIVRNLIGNAIKFTEHGTIRVGIHDNGDSFTVCVSDTGIGMPESKINSIFSVDRARSTKGTRGEGGSGLGLLICKEFSLKIGGVLQAESVENEGSTFKFKVPKRMKTSTQQ